MYSQLRSCLLLSMDVMFAFQPLCLCMRVAPGAVQDLKAIAEDSVSIRVSWRSPAQPNGPITQYRLQVLVDDVLLQDITLAAEMVSWNVYCLLINVDTCWYM